jgi:hypothetical protein
MKHFLQNHLRQLLLVSASVLLCACGSDDRGGFACAAVVNPYGAVRLTAKDISGKLLSGYKATYQYNFGSGNSSYPTEILCETTDECALTGNGGEYSITINKDGFQPTSLKVTVRSEFCNVYTEKVNVTLKSLN